jgi:hypothetical protein
MEDFVLFMAGSKVFRIKHGISPFSVIPDDAWGALRRPGNCFRSAKAGHPQKSSRRHAQTKTRIQRPELLPQTQTQI